MRNMAGRSRGFAIVKFLKESDSLAAIRALNGTVMDERAIEVLIFYC